MKKTILTTASALLLAGIAASAQDVSYVGTVAVKNFKTERSGDFLSVDMSIDLKKLNVSIDQAVVLTPIIVSENHKDTISLPSVGVYGRARYFHYTRKGKGMITKKEQSYRFPNQMPDTVAYGEVINYQDWMDGAEISLMRRDYGCCNDLLRKQFCALGSYSEPVEIEYFPELVFAQGDANTEKIRNHKGTAFIDFRVNKTNIEPEFRRNDVELGKIQATIDSVRRDKDMTITSVWLKGYASPESPYSNNKKLAIGRTDALKDYIQQLYHFKRGIIETDYEPENWEGLRAYVEESNIDHRRDILRIIDSSREPDAKELHLKRTYPKEYRFLLDNCYPSLRRTDYRIDYTIRSYTSVEEIKRVYATAPGKLSLNEFYALAQEFDPGSDAFIEVFETAVRVYPDDEIANINAANVAMRGKNYEAAERYLKKAGNSPEAHYARGAYAFLMEDYDTARAHLVKAEVLGVEQATETIAALDEIVEKLEKKAKK